MLTTWAPQGTNTWNSYWLGPRGGPGLGAAPAVAYPTSSTPNVTVQINFPGSCNAGSPVTVAIPAGTDVGTGNSENKLTVMLPNGEEWDFFDITPPNTATFNYTNEGGPASCAPNGNWQALEAVKHSPGWTGPGSTSAQWSDSNIPFGAGIIRKRDIVNTPAGGNWGHALMIDYSNNCARSGSPYPSFVYPATTSDGNMIHTSSSCTPMGARWQLDPSINIDTWPSLVGKPEWLKQLCRTLQVYGGITGHSAVSQGNGDGIWTEWYGNLGGWKFPWQDQTTGAIANYYSPSMNLPPDLLSHFRVINWTQWTGQ